MKEFERPGKGMEEWAELLAVDCCTRPDYKRDCHVMTGKGIFVVFGSCLSTAELYSWMTGTNTIIMSLCDG
jgi:hypothetical protein